MNGPLDVFVVSASPIFGSAVQRMLEGGPLLTRTRVARGAELAEVPTVPDSGVVLVAPQSWEEFAEQLPALRRRLGHRPWLVLAEPRLVGIFLSVLEQQPCALVPTGSSPDDLWDALGALSHRRYSCASMELLARFMRGIARRPKLHVAGRLSVIELQCACAVSLGLNNEQIARCVFLCESTVKSHLCRVTRKMGLRGRQELAAAVHEALCPPARSPSRRATMTSESRARQPSTRAAGEKCQTRRSALLEPSVALQLSRCARTG